MAPRPIPIVPGQRFAKLVVLGQGPSKHGTAHVLVQCDCGNQRNVNYSKLRAGTIKACGCLRGKNRFGSAGIPPVDRVMPIIEREQKTINTSTQLFIEQKRQRRRIEHGYHFAQFTDNTPAVIDS